MLRRLRAAAPSARRTEAHAAAIGAPRLRQARGKGLSALPYSFTRFLMKTRAAPRSSGATASTVSSAASSGSRGGGGGATRALPRRQRPGNQ